MLLQRGWRLPAPQAVVTVVSSGDGVADMFTSMDDIVRFLA